MRVASVMRDHRALDPQVTNRQEISDVFRDKTPRPTYRRHKVAAPTNGDFRPATPTLTERLSPPRLRALLIGIGGRVAQGIAKSGGVLAACVLSLVGCAGGPRSSANPSTTTKPSTTTTVDQTAEILKAYRGFWEAAFASLSPPNPDHPALEEFATGVQLERSREVAATDSNAGIATRPGEPSIELRPRVREQQGNAALVVDCFLDTNVRYRLDTGDVVGDRKVSTSVEARLVRMDGRWRVERTTIRALGEEESCDALAPSPR